MSNELQPVLMTLDVDGKKHKITGRDVRLRLEPEGLPTPTAAAVSEQISMQDGVLTMRTTTRCQDEITTTIVKSGDDLSSHDTKTTRN